MKVELEEGFETLREQRRAQIVALAQELGRQPLQREIADELGISRSYAASLTHDPDGSKERERKARYAGVCEDCGGPTSGHDGRAQAPKRCRDCVSPSGGGVRGPRPALRIWDEEKCLDAIVRWVERNGRIPRALDLLYAEPGERPCYGTIIRHCFRYETVRGHGRHWGGYGTGMIDGPFEWQRRTRGLPEILGALAPRFPAEAIIAGAQNALTRARLFEAVGIEKIVAEAGEQVAVDDSGTLWRLHKEGWLGEPLVMVEVVNSSPEPDGTHRHYFLRVPPTIETARAAVAWTFGIESAEEYELAVQT